MIGASNFYHAESQELGQDFLDEVQLVIEVLRQQPMLGSPVGSGLRRAPLHRFPFSVIYADEPDNIIVIAIAHQSRRPGYWRRRVDP